MNDTNNRLQLIEREQEFRRNLAAKPGSFAALNNLALILRELGQSPEAERLLRQALGIAPDRPELSVNLALVLNDRQQWKESETLLLRALSLSGGSPFARVILGWTFQASGREPEAEAMFRQAIADQPDFADAHRRLAAMLREQGRMTEAEAALHHAIERCPDSIDCRKDLSDLLNRKEESSGPRRELDDARRLALKACEALFLEGVDWRARQRMAEADRAFSQFVDTWPDGPVEAYCELVGRFRIRGYIPEAVQALRRVLTIHPDSPPLRYTLALLLLGMEQYEEGWTLHESRLVPSPEWKRRSIADPVVVFPPIVAWKGEPLTQRSLLVVSEQGLGDTIQFVRFARVLKQMGVARLCVVAPRELLRLFSHVEGVDECVEIVSGADLANYDRWCYMMSIPHLLGTAWPGFAADVPYIRLPAAHGKPWKERMKKQVTHGALKVGLVWEGSAVLGNQRNRVNAGDALNNKRSVRLTALAPLLGIPGVRFFSLQKGGARAQLEELEAETRPIDWMPDVRDMLDTAEIIENLDLVISVDTAVLHLAGALGKPVWGLMREHGDWRWMEDREDSPWYPSLRLFRQRESLDWEEVVVRVGKSLRELAESRTSR